jgi:hypothetical protein
MLENLLILLHTMQALELINYAFAVPVPNHDHLLNGKRVKREGQEDVLIS